MIERIVLMGLLLGGIYWYWSGPYQARVNPGYAAILDENERKLGECIRAEAYRNGATGGGLASEKAQAYCAGEYNLYLHDDGRWHRYDIPRPD